MKPLSDAALAVLSAATVDGNVVHLAGAGPGVLLPRPLYEEVDRALVAMGGKWNRKAKGHLFEEDPSEALDNVLQNGGYVDRKQLLGFFETPIAIAERVVLAARVTPGMRVLEPSAGRGGILVALPMGLDVVEVCELDSKNMPHLDAALRRFGPDTSTTVVSGDFLTRFHASLLFDAVVMNPPFARQADIDHVLHAYSFLAKGGRLASVMSRGVRYRENAKTVAFRQLVKDRGGTIQDLPDGSFRQSGTDVQTVLVTIPA